MATTLNSIAILVSLVPCSLTALKASEYGSSIRVPYPFSFIPSAQNDPQNVEDIFALLADLHKINHFDEEDFQHYQDPLPLHSTPKNVDTVAGGILRHDQAAVGENEDVHTNSFLEFVNDLSSKAHVISSEFENMASLLQRIEQLYSRKKVEGFPVFGGKNKKNFIDFVLDVPTLESIWKTGVSAVYDNDVMEGMVDAVVMAEGRQGAALTLDPVTIIALLTLAAYLIRAVYQILTVTGRSLEVEDIFQPLYLSDNPEYLVKVHNWLSPSQIDTMRSIGGGVPSNGVWKKQPSSGKPSLLAFPGSIAAFVKLHRDGHTECARQFMCEAVLTEKKSSLQSLILTSVGYLYGDKTVGSFADQKTLENGNCFAFIRRCSPNILKEAHRLKILFTKAAQSFSNVVGLLERQIQ